MNDRDHSPHGRREESPRNHNKKSYSRSPSRSRKMSYREGDRDRERRREERDSRRYSRSRSDRRYKSSRYSRSRSHSGGYGRRSHSHSPMSSRRRHLGTRDNPKPSRCLGVFGLSVYTTENELYHIFSKYGPVERVQVVIDAKTGRSRGFSFVYFESTEDAKVAKEQCTGLKINGKSIRVDYSITERAHTPTPGIYMGKPTDKWDRRRDRDRDDYYGGGGYRGSKYSHRRSPSPYYRRRRYDRSRSRSYSPPGVIRRLIYTRRSHQEVQIPVPWGHIAGKWWGPQHKRPILALHGWQDNSGTFDTLIPQLPKHIPVLALDFPGHGHSSCLPPGMPCYNGSFNKAILVKRLAQYFGWKRLSLMGHSLGGIAAYTYTVLFPGEVDFLICLDGLYPLTYPNEYDRIANCIELFIKYDEQNNSKTEPPVYTYAEMEKKTHEGSHLYSHKSVDLDCAKYLLARNLKPSKVHPGKFYFKRDPRIKAGQLELHNSTELVKYASRVECPVFVTRSERGSLLGDRGILRNVLAAIKKCQFHEAPGTHHVHLNQPEVIVRLLNDFIEKHDCKEEERSYGGIKAEIKVPEDVYDVTLGGLEEIKLGGRRH